MKCLQKIKKDKDFQICSTISSCNIKFCQASRPAQSYLQSLAGWYQYNVLLVFDLSYCKVSARLLCKSCCPQTSQLKSLALSHLLLSAQCLACLALQGAFHLYFSVSCFRLPILFSSFVSEKFLLNTIITSAKLSTFKK